MENCSVEKLSSLWGRQLHVEFEEICWKYKLRLNAPVFEISKTEKELGAWHPETRTIRISSMLIRNHSWDITVNVLKHEIAHQLCSEHFGSNSLDHGKEFHKACDLLGVAAPFRCAQTDLSEASAMDEERRHPVGQGQRLLSRVEKLLALSQSANENEAALAVKKANELIAKFHLNGLVCQDVSDYTYVIINRKKKRIEAYQRKICALLRDFFYVKIVFSSLYDPLSNQHHKTIELLGATEKVAVAEYCYTFLENRLAVFWSRSRASYQPGSRREMNSYYQGVLQGFYDSLQARQECPAREKSSRNPIEKLAEKGLQALVRAEEHRLDTFVGQRFPRLRRVSRRGARLSRGAYEDGVAVGKTLTLPAGLARQDGEKSLALPEG